MVFQKSSKPENGSDLPYFYCYYWFCYSYGEMRSIESSSALQMPALRLTIITVMLSLFMRAEVASRTTWRATMLTSYSIMGIDDNFAWAKLIHSWLVKRSKSPSEANKKKSSVSGLMVVTRISGSHKTKFFTF